MGASDYMVGNAPSGASFAAPLAGFALGQSIAGLPDQYMQGREMKRTIALQDAFKDGIPQNPDGSPNVNAIVDKGAKIGGLPFVQQMLPFLQQVALGNQAAGDLAGAGPGGAPSAPQPRPSGSAAGPGNLGAGPATQPQGRPQPAGEAGPTINTIITESGRSLPQAAIFSLARQLRINPSAELNPDQVGQVKAALGQLPKQVASSEDVTPPTGATSAAERGVNGPSGASERGPGAPNGATAAPFMASGASGAPAPQEGSAGGAAAPPQTASAGLAPGVTESTARNLETAAQGLRAKAARYAALKNPELSQTFEKQAEAYDARAKGIRDQLGEAAKFTGEQKNARDQSVAGFKRQEEVVKADIEQSKKKYDGLQNLGQVGQIGNQKLDRIRSVMSDPNFMSGAGNTIALAWKQWNATLGGDPKAAAPMEEFNKTAQQLLTDDIKAMGASGAGPVRVAEVNIMKQATANLGISPATNRYLVEEAYRVHNDNIAVARLANQYKQDHGYLDAGWDKVRDQYYEQHALFTKEELADPRLVSPPYLPRDVAADPAKHATWLRQQGIKPGDPIKTDDPKRPIVWAK